MSLYVSDVERSISWPHVTHGDEEDVNEGPDAQSAETEELAQSLSPLTQIKAVGSKPTQSDAERQCCGPFISPSPVAEEALLEFPFS